MRNRGVKKQQLSKWSWAQTYTQTFDEGAREQQRENFSHAHPLSPAGTHHA